ncbi:hypothetical protein JCM10914A_09130 [Paenibacillus sp. JCM 10914]|uniref:alpha/beta hydrolase n=1 Tax=Paenibacillus sp. JCM 10914 TaxID=1236974 RepID=UPI0003CC95E0|nr:alpha/beta hydrolase-fold protein [Paenibacillus sp. JCM 10914]GAE09705.1 putative esterase [Paenibacillus sp. JCM 10914]
MNHYQELVLGDRKIILYLPPSYKNSIRSYPVVYVQDNGELFTDSLNYVEHLFIAGEVEEVILVGISPFNRNDEYTPWPAEALLQDRPSFGGQGKSYVDEVADVIKTHIDSHYRTLTEPQHTAIMGGSFGGLISMFAGYWRPETFGRIGMLSASLWYVGVLDFIREQKVLPPTLQVFMSVGQVEGAYKTNLQRYMYPNNLEAFQLWVKDGAAAGRLQLEVDADGTHDAIFMSRRFIDALRWHFSTKETSSGTRPDMNNAECFRIPGTVTWSMRSHTTDCDYRIFITEPMGPPPEDGYPILYSLDGNATFGSLAEAIRLQSRTPRGIAPAIIVGIGYDSESPIVTEERFRDYTIEASQEELPARPDGSKWPATGGAEEFLTFIEEQLKPEVERRYPVNRRQQTLFGHSLGGFFTMYVLFTKPERFQRYVAASPSIWWKDHMLCKLCQDGIANIRQCESKPQLHLYVGTNEKPSMVQDARNMNSVLRGNPETLETTFVEVEGEGHVSILPALISPLLRLVTSSSAD